MTRVIGRLTKIGIGRETTRGTTVAPLYWVPVLDLGFDDAFELKDNESGFGNLANIQDSQIVKQWSEGDYSGKIFDKSVALELAAVFGGVPTSTQRTTTGVYDSVYAMVQNNQHPVLTTALAESNFTGRYALCGINSWKLEAEVGDYVKRTVNLIGKKGVSGADSPTYTNENEFIAKHLAVRIAAAGAVDATLYAATPIKVKSVNFEINKNAEALFLMGSNDLDDVINKAVEVTGEFEMYYDDRAMHTLAQAGTHQALGIEMINTDTIIGTSGTHNPALRFSFREVALDYPERGFDNNDVTTIKVGFRAMLNLATGEQITARVTNAVNVQTVI